MHPGLPKVLSVTTTTGMINVSVTVGCHIVLMIIIILRIALVFATRKLG